MCHNHLFILKQCLRVNKRCYSTNSNSVHNTLSQNLSDHPSKHSLTSNKLMNSDKSKCKNFSNYEITRKNSFSSGKLSKKLSSKINSSVNNLYS